MAGIGGLKGLATVMGIAPAGGPTGIAREPLDVGDGLSYDALRDTYRALGQNRKFSPGGAGNSAAPADMLTTHDFRRSVLCDRLRMTYEALAKALPGFGTTYDDRAQKVFVHFPKDGKLTVFEDDAGMYPSDQLVTQMRLCL